MKNVIHVEFHEGPRKGKHYYFGCIAAIFDKFTKEDTGASKEYLYRKKITPENPFKSKFCHFRKGVFHRKPNPNRKGPIKIIRVL